MTNFIVELFKKNNLTDIVYAEPYAGGAGAAINLLLKNSVNKILINDANIGIFSFWYYVIKENSRFVDMIQGCEVSLREWHRWKDVFKTATKSSFELGFATFFLTRTNRSGVLNAGPIGGVSAIQQEKAKYKIDCRYNRQNLAQKVKKIGTLADRIEVFNLDALDFLQLNNVRDNLFVYLDPPYFQQGKSLYMDYYTQDNHRDLAFFLSQKAHFDWILSYDNVYEIRQLYKDFPLYEFDLNYSVRTHRKGRELLLHSNSLSFPKKMSFK
ncbi:MAG: DNA adenine methylase [Bacteroidales bacterium]|nr:DNA adenine methylase [Bacteroidales bacterium]